MSIGLSMCITSTLQQINIKKTYHNNTKFCKKYIPYKRCSMPQSTKKITPPSYKVGGTYTKKRCNDMWEGHNSVRNFKMSLENA
jgi:hypothetical protein